MNTTAEAVANDTVADLSSRLGEMVRRREIADRELAEAQADNADAHARALIDNTSHDVADSLAQIMALRARADGLGRACEMLTDRLALAKERDRVAQGARLMAEYQGIINERDGVAERAYATLVHAAHDLRRCGVKPQEFDLFIERNVKPPIAIFVRDSTPEFHQRLTEIRQRMGAYMPPGAMPLQADMWSQPVPPTDAAVAAIAVAMKAKS